MDHSMTPTDNDEKVQNVTFSDESQFAKLAIDQNTDPTYDAVPTGDVSLQNFLSRPIKIFSTTWTPNLSFVDEFNPWTLFLTNARVANRIAGYSLIRCNLKVKFMINGNPFYYGRAIATYRPLPTIDKLHEYRTNEEVDLVRNSQLPHVFLNPTDSSAGEMALPFFWPNSFMSVLKEEWQKMGSIDVRSMTTLKHANGGTDPITVTAFAWAEDVVLSLPSQANPASLIPQSGEGKISKPASSVARIAGKLKDIPVIGPYMMAGETIGNAISSVASTFGYCRPNIDKIDNVRPAFVGNTANTNVPDNCTPLSYDFNQQVTIDPATVGLGNTDEMALAHVWTKESYMCKFGFATTDLPEERIFCTLVDPGVQRVKIVEDAANEWHKTACSFATLPFHSWRGSMKYRFQIVSSGYHRGRLKFVYDPVESQETAEYNVAYTKIVDINEEKDFTLTVGWGQAQQYRHILHNDDDETKYFRVDGGKTPVLSTSTYGNGELSVYVVNGLTSPNSTIDNNIEIIVYVSCGDDFEVAKPTSEYMTHITPVSDYVTQSGECDEPENTTSAELNPTSPTGDFWMICKGEEYKSIRNLVKRYCFGNYLAGVATVAAENRLVYTAPAFPMHYGRTEVGPFESTGVVGTYDRNYGSIPTLLGYYSTAYAGMRGSIKLKILGMGLNGSETEKVINVTKRTVHKTFAVFSSHDQTAIPADRVAVMANALGYGPDGMVFSPAMQQPINEVQIPYYSELRFLSPRVRLWHEICDENDLFAAGDYPAFTHEMWNMAGNGDNGNADRIILISFAAGDDFSLFFYQGPPVFYSYTDAYSL
jgi:hypothetical protein